MERFHLDQPGPDSLGTVTLNKTGKWPDVPSFCAFCERMGLDLHFLTNRIAGEGFSPHAYPCLVLRSTIVLKKVRRRRFFQRLLWVFRLVVVYKLSYYALPALNPACSICSRAASAVEWMPCTLSLKSSGLLAFSKAVS